MNIQKILNDREKLNCLVFMAVITLVAIAARIYLYPLSNGDQTTFLIPWFEHIKENGGFLALNERIGDYTPPYYYIMAILTYLPFEPMTGIKTVSCIFDFIMAVYVFKIVKYMTGDSIKAAIAYGCILFLPTVFLNSAAWGQCDGIYVAFIVMSIYYILKRNDYKAIIFYTIAFCFKLQAIFVAPFLLLLLMNKRVSVKKIWVFPVVYIVAMLPAVIVGDSLIRIIGIYIGQTGTYTSGLAYSTATIYSFLNGVNIPELASAGVMVAGAASLILMFYFYSKKYEVTDEFVITGGALFSLIVPFLLPYMHERYYYMAVVFTAILAFISKKNLWRLIVMEIVSVMGMSVFLLKNSVNNWFLLSAAAVVVIYSLFTECNKIINSSKIKEREK